MASCNYCQPGALCPYHGHPTIDGLRARIAKLEAVLRDVQRESIVTQSWTKLAPKIRAIVDAVLDR